MPGRVCTIHQEWCPTGTCRWCEPLADPAVEAIVYGDGIVPRQNEGTRVVLEWVPEWVPSQPFGPPHPDHTIKCLHVRGDLPSIFDCSCGLSFKGDANHTAHRKQVAGA